MSGKHSEESDSVSKAIGDAEPSAPRWLRVVLPVLLVLGVGFALWQARIGQLVIGDVHHRNFHALDVAANGLEYWPGTVRGLAIANFTREASPAGGGAGGAMQGNLADADARHASEGWQYQAQVYHPRFGQLDILYRLESGREGCRDFRQGISEQERAPLPFISSYRVGEGPQLKIVDEIPLKEIWLRDNAPTAKHPPTIAIGDKPAQPWDANLCYGVTVSLDKLLALERAAPQFSNVLIIDDGTHIRQQLGARPIPVDSLDNLAPANSQLTAMLASTSGVKLADNAPRDRRLTNALAPVPIDVAGEGYEAYVHPFRLPPGVPGCAAGTANAEKTCFLIGLMPRSLLWQSALRPTPYFLTALGFTVAIVLLLLPPARLLLMGSGDAISRYFARATILSVLAFTSVLTLLILFSLDVARERQAMNVEGHRTAQSMAAEAADEIRALVRKTAAMAEGPDGNSLFGTAAAIPSDATWPTRIHSTGYERTGNPPLESIAAIGGGGSPLACGAWQLKFRPGAAGRFNVGGRDYFQRLLAERFDGVVRDGNGSAPISYTIDQVRDQTDGISKTIILQTPPPLTETRTSACQPVALLTSAVLPTFHAPILPYRLSYAVIDDRNPVFPVLLHQDSERVGAEDMGRDLDRSGLRHLRHWVSAGMPPGYRFAAKYDGQERDFFVQHIDGTTWAVMVFFAGEEVDQTAATSVARALIAGCALSIAFAIAWGLFTLFYPDVVTNLWPHERPNSHFLCQDYGRSSLVLGCVVAIDVLATIILDATYAITIVLLGALASVVLLHLNSWRRGEVTHPLSPRTERRYFLLILVFIAGTSVLPTIAIWRDASAYTRADAAGTASQAMLGRDGVFARRWLAGEELRKAWCSKRTCPANGFFPLSDGGLFLEERVAGTADATVPFLSSLWELADDEPKVDSESKTDTRSPCSRRDSAFDAYCLRTGGAADAWSDDARIAGALLQLPGAIAFSSHGLSSWPMRWSAAIVIVLLVIVAMLATFLLVRSLLVALAGFGIPLEIVTNPRLILSDAAGTGVRTIPERALLVGAPYSVRRAIGAMEATAIVDLADITSPPSEELWVRPRASVYLVINLHLLLRDSARRRAALARLEQLDRDLGDGPAKLVVLSSQAPLERILDAYERDRRNPEERAAVSRHREQLRWATLFEKFTTVGFPPSLKIDLKAVDEASKAAAEVSAAAVAVRETERDDEGWFKQSLRRLGSLLVPRPKRRDRTDQIASVRALMDELAWLPEEIVATTIGVSPDIPANRILPPRDEDFQAYFTQPAFRWAWALRIASRTAAIDYLRGLLIEHYQKCWSVSTYAERVVLDHIANRRLVNIDNARIPLASLVRRGLVIFAPEPRLMNRSFAMFACQAERPDRLRGWRRERAGAWAIARWPILLGLPLLIAVLAVAWMWSDADVANWAPLLAAGAPALLAGLFRSVRKQLPTA